MSDDDVAEAEIVGPHDGPDKIGDQPEATTAAMAIVPVEHGGLTRPVAGIDDVRAAFEQYLELRRTIVVESDITRIGKKDFVNKSGWRKLGTVMGTSSRIVSRDYQRDEHARVTSAEVIVRAIAPNGRFMEGLGACDFHERCCPRAFGVEGQTPPPVCKDGRKTHTHCQSGCDGFNHFSKPQHDIPATASTRALNRAMSDLFGFGEVSAEEVTDRDELAPEEWRLRVGAALGAIADNMIRAQVKRNFANAFGLPMELTNGQMINVEKVLRDNNIAIPDTVPDPEAAGPRDGAPAASPPEPSATAGPNGTATSGKPAGGESSGSEAAAGGKGSGSSSRPAAAPNAEPAKPATAQQKQTLGMRFAELVDNEYIGPGAKDELVGSLTLGRTTSRTQLSFDEATKLLALTHQIQNGAISVNLDGELPLLTPNNPVGDKFMQGWPAPVEAS